MEDDRLRRYYDPSLPGSFGGVNALAKLAGTSYKTAKDWLSNEFTYTLHRQARKRYVTRPYRTNKIDAQFQADLVEMQEFATVNDGYRYMLTVIDIFSRYAWARALKSKGAQDVVDAFRDILSEGRIPRSLQSDSGKEFENRRFQHLLNEHNIKFFTVHSPHKAAIVERFNRSVKGKMHKYFTYTGSHRWIDVIQQLVQSYNAPVHRSIGIAPVNVNQDNEMDIWMAQQTRGPQRVTLRDKHPEFAVGDSVRISHAKKVFDKGYLPTWTDQVYTISRIIKTPKIETQFAGPVQYIIKDYYGEEILGAFYGFELQKITPPERFRVERVIRQRVRRGRVQYFVKWMGYGPEFNSWVNELEPI